MAERDCSRFQGGVPGSGGVRGSAGAESDDPPRRPRPPGPRRARAPGWEMVAAPVRGAAEVLRRAVLALELLVGLDHALVLPARLNGLLERPLHPRLHLTT